MIKSNLPRMIEAKYAEILDLVNRCTFRAVFIAELPDGANLITVRYVVSIKSDEYKEERYKARYISGAHLDIMRDLPNVWRTNHTMRIGSYNPSCREDQRFSYMGS